MNLILLLEYIALGFVVLLLLGIAFILLFIMLEDPIMWAVEVYRREGGRVVILKLLKVSAFIAGTLLLCMVLGYAAFEYTSATPKSMNQTLAEAFVDFLVVQ